MIQRVPILNWLWGRLDGFFDFLARIPVPDPETLYTFGRQLRALAIWTGILWVAVAGSAWFFATDILLFLLKPVEGKLSPFPGGLPVFTEPTGAFFVTIDLAVRSGLLVALPFFMVGLYKILPAKPSPPYKFLFLHLPLVLALHVAGMAFVYFIILPRGLGFLLGFGTEFAVPLITINSYFSFVKQLFLFVPLAFQMPVVMWLLARTKILTYRRIMRFRKIRKTVPLGLAIFTAIITPTVDHVNFFIMYIPMLLLFEIGMFLMWIQEPEQGNYLWLRTIKTRILWLWHLPCRIYWKLVGRPLGRLWRLVRRK